LSNGMQGAALTVQAVPITAEPAVAHVAGSFIERSTMAGINVLGSMASVERTVIRDTATQPADDAFGEGIHVQLDQGNRATLALERSLIEHNHSSGIAALGSDIQLNASVVRATQPNAAGLDGIGIGVLSLSNQATTLAIESSVIEDVFEVGVLADESQLTMKTTRVSRVLPQRADGSGGVCVSVQNVSGPQVDASVEHSALGPCSSFGLEASGSRLAASNVVVTDVAAGASDGLLGDGVSIISFETPASATLSALSISRSYRAGISNFGAAVVLSDSLLDCNELDLAAQGFETSPFSFEDGGNNQCGCGESTSPCRLQQTMLEPPSQP